MRNYIEFSAALFEGSSQSLGAATSIYSCADDDEDLAVLFESWKASVNDNNPAPDWVFAATVQTPFYMKLNKARLMTLLQNLTPFADAPPFSEPGIPGYEKIFVLKSPRKKGRHN